MSIKGKTDKSATAGKGRLQVIYRLWKGEKKGERTAGKDLLDKMRFEAPDPIRDAFLRHYPSDRPQSIRIFLPYATTDEVFETWYESYTAQGFQHRCNGETIIEKMVPHEVTSGKKASTRWYKSPCSDPCQRGDSPVCPLGCGNYGRLFFYVRELYDAGMGSTKCGMLTATGVHDVVGLTNQLRAIEDKYGALHRSPFPSPETFGYIPYILTRVEKSISRPNGDYRARGTTWVLSISEDPEWLAKLQRWLMEQEMVRLASLNLPGYTPEPIALPEKSSAPQPRKTSPEEIYQTLLGLCDRCTTLEQLDKLYIWFEGKRPIVQGSDIAIACDELLYALSKNFAEPHEEAIAVEAQTVEAQTVEAQTA